MIRGTAFTPDGPLTLGDLRQIVADYIGNRPVTEENYSDDRIVEIRTPMAPDRRRVTLTVTDQRWTPPAPNTDAGPSDAETEGTEHNG